MRELRGVRQQLGIPTTFNMVGPLLNPASPQHYLLGVYDEKLLNLFARTLQKIGTTRSVVVCGNSIDEVSCVGKSKIIEVTEKSMKFTSLDPEALGLSLCSKQDLEGGDAKENAELLLQVFSGKQSVRLQAIAETLILNVAVALYLYGTHSSIRLAVSHAKEKLKDGSALKLLLRWKEFSHDQLS
jgi:anthranilate phosphoribosyltransferase